MPLLSRRNFLKSALLGGTAAITLSPAFSLTTSDLQLTKHDLFLPDIPSSLEGLRISYLSDLHLGPWVRHELIASAVALSNSLHPDLVILGGDYIWVPDGGISKHFTLPINSFLAHTPSDQRAKITFAELGYLLSPLEASIGIFAVFGNHDRWVDPSLCADAMATCGATLLVNDTTSVAYHGNQITIVGVDDYWTGIPRRAVLRDPRSPPESFRLLISHNPDFVAREILPPLAAHGDAPPFDLALSGHTHGGQIRFPLLGPLTYNVIDRRFGEGLVQVGRNSFVFTSRGIGVVELPFRLNCPPEVSLLTLRKRPPFPIPGAHPS